LSFAHQLSEKCDLTLKLRESSPAKKQKIIVPTALKHELSPLPESTTTLQEVDISAKKQETQQGQFNFSRKDWASTLSGINETPVRSAS